MEHCSGADLGLAYGEWAIFGVRYTKHDLYKKALKCVLSDMSVLNDTKIKKWCKKDTKPWTSELLIKFLYRNAGLLPREAVMGHVPFSNPAKPVFASFQLSIDIQSYRNVLSFQLST